MMDILGPYALTNDAKQASRGSFRMPPACGIITAPGGSAEIQKVRMARRIGIGRTTKEQASDAT